MKLVSVAAIAVAAFAVTPVTAFAAPCDTIPVVFTPDGSSGSVLFNTFPTATATGPGGYGSASCEQTVAIPTWADGYSVWNVDPNGFIDAPDDADQFVTLSDTNLTGDTEVLRVEGPHTDVYPEGEANYRVGAQPGEDLEFAFFLEATAGDAVTSSIELDSFGLALLGYVTDDIIAASLEQVANGQVGLMSDIGGSAGLLLGLNGPLEGDSAIGGIAAIGSGMLGVNGRANFGSGFSVLGGAALFQHDSNGSEAYGALFAGGLRFVDPSDSDLRFFAEAGAWGSPYLGLSIGRDYFSVNIDNIGDGGGTISTSTDTDGALAAVYGRAGLLFEPSAGNTLMVSAALERNWLSFESYAEDTDGNIFALTADGQTVTVNVAKLQGAWTTEVMPNADLTVSGGIGRTFGGAGVVSGEMEWVGDVAFTGDDITFVEFGANLGFDVAPDVRANAFVAGTASSQIGAHAQFGGSVLVGF